MTAAPQIRGAVASSDWTTPDHRARAMPPGCRHVHAKDAPAIAALPAHARAAVAALKVKRPRVRWIIVNLSETETPNLTKP